jgi:hypothetical protein
MERPSTDDLLYEVACLEKRVFFLLTRTTLINGFYKEVNCTELSLLVSGSCFTPQRRPPSQTQNEQTFGCILTTLHFLLNLQIGPTS